MPEPRKVDQERERRTDAVRRSQPPWVAWSAEEAKGQTSRGARRLAKRAFEFVYAVELDAAILAAEQALKLDPEYPRAHAVRGAALAGIGRYGEAVAACARAVELNAEDYLVQYCYAIALHWDGRCEEALAACELALKGPDKAGIYIVQGHILSDLERFGEALVSYSMALEDNESTASHIAWRLRELSDTVVVTARDNEALGERQQPVYTGDNMDTAAAIAAARAILSRVPAAERVVVLKALENLTDEATGGVGAGTDDLANGKPRPEAAATETTSPAATDQPRPKGAPVAASSAAPRTVTAEELFANVPAGLQPKPRQKYVFSAELLDNHQAFKAAETMANARSYKVRNQLPLTAEEDEQGLKAASLVSQYRRRHLQPKGDALPKAG